MSHFGTVQSPSRRWPTRWLRQSLSLADVSHDILLRIWPAQCCRDRGALQQSRYAGNSFENKPILHMMLVRSKKVRFKARKRMGSLLLWLEWKPAPCLASGRQPS